MSCGVDLVSNSRFSETVNRCGPRLLQRLFTDSELRRFGTGDRSILAMAFAGKEAVLKSLGTGLSGGIAWHDIEISIDDPSGPSHVTLHRRALSASGGASVGLSMSGCGDLSIAIAIMDPGGEGQP